MPESATKPPKLVKRFRGAVYEVLKATSPALLHAVSKRFARTCSENWRYRAKMVRSCPDFAHISKVADAGCIVDGYQLMHNGLKVVVGSYYGTEASVLFSRTKGVHEPQEERIFEQVLKYIKPGAVMIELGAYWAFYSMWFCKEVPDAKPFLVEPIQVNLEFGRKNFALNGYKGDFTRAFVGRASSVSDSGDPVICVDDFVLEKGITKVAILHCDIQGFELDMLKGAEEAIRRRMIDYYFISTHSEQLHADCEGFLRQRGLRVLESIKLAESFSMDGILVCCDPGVLLTAPVELSRRVQKS